VQFGGYSVIPVNMLPLAYTMRGSIRQWNALTCRSELTREKRFILQEEEEEGRGIRKLNSLRWVKKYIISL